MNDLIFLKSKPQNIRKKIKIAKTELVKIPKNKSKILKQLERVRKQTRRSWNASMLFNMWVEFFFKEKEFIIYHSP